MERFAQSLGAKVEWVKGGSVFNCFQDSPSTCHRPLSIWVPKSIRWRSSALTYSCIPAIILGRLKLPLAKRLHEKVLYVNSHAQKADWLTAAGGMVGVIGVGFGIWWLDAVVAIAISSSIVYDGIARTRDSMKDLLEEIPTTTENKKIHPLVDEVISTSLQCAWVSDVRVRLRESGMVFVGDVLVIPTYHDNLLDNTTRLREQLMALDWKIADIVISPVRDFSRFMKLLVSRNSKVGAALK